MIRKKSGRLNKDERKYIVQNAGKKTVLEIAEHLNRYEELVQTCVDNIGKIDGERPSKVAPTNEESLKIQLKSRYYWPTIKKQLLGKMEEEFFALSWCEIMEQFRNDVLPTEEQQVKELILTEIYKNRAAEAKVRELRKIEETDCDILKELQKPLGARDPIQLQLLEAQNGYAKTNAQQYSQELEKYSKITKELNNALKGTRDQRFSKIESGNKTFQAIIKDLMDEGNRDKEGREAELMKIAIDKKTLELYEPHTYMDGGVDSPIYNVDSVEYNANKQEEEDNSGDT